MGKAYHVNLNQNKAVVAVLISEKVDFRVKSITRNTEYHFLVMKEPVHQGDIKILSIMYLITKL